MIVLLFFLSALVPRFGCNYLFNYTSQLIVRRCRYSRRPINSLFIYNLFFYSPTETAMGVSIDALSKPNSEYVKAVKELVH